MAPSTSPVCVFSCEGEPLVPDSDGVLRIHVQSPRFDYRFDLKSESEAACKQTTHDVCSASHIKDANERDGVPHATSFHGLVEMTTRSSQSPACFVNCGGPECEIKRDSSGQCHPPLNCDTQMLTYTMTEDECRTHAKHYCSNNGHNTT